MERQDHALAAEPGFHGVAVIDLVHGLYDGIRAGSDPLKSIVRCRSQRRIRREEREDHGTGQSSSASHGRKRPVAGGDTAEVNSLTHALTAGSMRGFYVR